MNQSLLYNSLLIYCFILAHIAIGNNQDNSTYEENIKYYRTLYEQSPDDRIIAEDLAYLLAYTHHDVEALNIYQRLLQQDPTATNILNNVGFLLARSGETKQAINVYKHALAHNDNAQAHLNLAISYLTYGDLARGFREYEWRWKALNEKHETFDKEWHGCDLDGKRICVHAEQGCGDTFMFIRYLSLLKNMGAHVIFITQPPLQSLLCHCPYIDTLCTFDEPLPEFDYFCALLSLPHVFKTQQETIPATIPYLYADEKLIQEWKQKIAIDFNYKIGICWHGKTNYGESCAKQFLAARSCELEYFKIIAAIPGISLYSIQKIDGLEQIMLYDANSFMHIFTPFDEEHGRFMDTAALIKNLDLVITVDTSTAHLAAALGVETWILIPEPADWRWMESITDTPWYPNVRLFRQQMPGDWPEVMQTVAQILQEHIDYTGS